MSSPIGMLYVIKCHESTGALILDGIELIPFTHDVSLVNPKIVVQMGNHPNNEKTNDFVVKVSYPSNLIPDLTLNKLNDVRLTAVSQINTAYGLTLV
jgi:hypothetical protein